MFEKQIRNLIKKYENEYKIFMGIESFPEYRLELIRLDSNKISKIGFGAVAAAKYNWKTNKHILQIFLDITIEKHIVFHEFTHILDSEMYVQKNPRRYMGLSGYTEYHAAQVELMVLLGANSVQQQDLLVDLDFEIMMFAKKNSVKEYILSRYQTAMNIMRRKDFPRDIEALKGAVGALYNYFGMRSICKMYGGGYSDEDLDNTSIVQKIPELFFDVLNKSMNGWLTNDEIEESIIRYYNSAMNIIQKYNLS